MQETKYIGNIVTTYNKDKFLPIFNVIREKEGCIKDIPTLFIGLDMARDNIENFSILKKEYEEKNIWWTYKKTERKYDFDNDIESFYGFCLNKFLTNVKYFYFDLPRYHYSDIKRILEWLGGNSEKTCFLTRESNFMFIYDKEKNIVFGLSLTLAEYIGVNRKKIVSLVRKNRKNTFLYDTSFINGDIRRSLGDNTHYILPLATIFQN